MKAQLKFIFILLIVSILSCENWMELLPPDDLIREEFWQSKEDVESAVLGAYASLAELDGLLFKYGEIRADMLEGASNQDEDEEMIMEGSIYADNALCDWSGFYEVINNCNEVIKYAPGVQDIDDTFTDFLLQGYLSEVYFLRGLTYFYLVRIFKDIPLVLEPSDSDDADFYPSKTDGDTILNYIKDELKGYRGYATVDGYQTTSENKGRATKGAYDALIADIALWQFDYDECIEYIEKIESNESYELMPTSRWFELFYPGNSLEGIFEIQYDSEESESNDLYTLTNKYGYYYIPGDAAIDIFSSDVDSENREIKRGEDSSIKKYAEDDYIIWKYVGKAADGTTIRSTDYAGCNWIVYRLADVLLMKAEALSQLGEYDEALEIINEIRDRANMSTLSVANTANSFEDVILEERVRELAFEGKRWFDLLRMGRRNDYQRKSTLIEIIIANAPSIQKQILKLKLSNPLGWYMPISDDELEQNKNLEQNEYYKE